MTQEQVELLIGKQTLQMYETQLTLAQARARIAELEAQYEPKEPAKPELKAVSE